MSLELAAAGYAVRGHRWLLSAATLQLRPGELLAVLGPNGAGKTTLLQLLAGSLRAVHGEARLDGRPLQQWKARDLARRRAVMMQRDSLPFAFRVEEVVALGRLPWDDEPPAATDARCAAALDRCDAAGLRGRSYATLSGGERARVQLARALVQIDAADAIPRYLLLDEPTASLDYAHQHRCLRELRREAAAGNGVLVILQDPQLARRYADRVLLLKDGACHSEGPAATVLAPAALHAFYGLGPDDPAP